MECKRASDGRALDDHTHQVMRQQAMKAVRDGQTVQRVAVGVNPGSVFWWLADFASGGQNVLVAKFIPCRPSTVSPEEMAWPAKAVRDSTPQQFRFEYGLGTLSLIRHLINRQFGKNRTIWSVSRVPTGLAFSAHKPL